MGRSNNSFASWVGTPHTAGGQDSEPETKLFTAVLSQAIHDIFSNHVGKMDRDQAMNFLTTDSFHLRMVCELAGRDASYVRGKIRKKILRENSWNVDVFVDRCRKSYRGTNKGRKRGPKFKNNALTPS